MTRTYSGGGRSGWVSEKYGVITQGISTLRDVDPDRESGDWQRCKSSWEVSQLSRVRQRGDSKVGLARGSSEHFLGPERAEKGSHVIPCHCCILKRQSNSSPHPQTSSQVLFGEQILWKMYTPEKQQILSCEQKRGTFCRQEGNYRHWDTVGRQGTSSRKAVNTQAKAEDPEPPQLASPWGPGH